MGESRRRFWTSLVVLMSVLADHEKAALALEGKGVANTPSLDPLGLAGGHGTLAPTGVQRTDLLYDPENPSPGWHKLEVALRSGKGRVRGRTGYWVEGSHP